MAMPYLEGVAEKSADQWLIQLTNQIKNIPQAKDKSILELQAQNWQKNGQHQAISSQQLAHWMSLLQLNGVKNYGYYPDNFLHNQPEIDLIRPEFSTAGIRKMINRIVSFFILCLVLCIPLCVAYFHSGELMMRFVFFWPFLCPLCGLLAASISGSIVNATGRGEKTHQLPS